MRLQHAAEGGFAGEIDALVGQHGHDARRRHRGKARLVGHGQQVRTLGLGEGMVRHRAHGLRPAIAADEAIGGLPALEGAQVDAGDLASQVQPGTSGMCNADFLG